MNVSAVPSIASILAAAERQAALIITQAKAKANISVNVSANVSAVRKEVKVHAKHHHTNVKHVLHAHKHVHVSVVNSSNVISAAQSLASLLFAEANVAHQHKKHIAHIIHKVHHNISHAQNISYNITVSNSIAKVVEAAQARALEVLTQAKLHIKVHHHNKTHSHIVVHIHRINVHVNHTKLGLAIHKARVEFAKSVNASVKVSSANIISAAEKLASVIYSEVNVTHHHAHANVSHVNASAQV